MVSTIDMVNTVDMVYTIDMVYTMDMVLSSKDEIMSSLQHPMNVYVTIC